MLMRKPCKRGHTGPRYKSGNCIQCERERYSTCEKKREQTKASARRVRAKRNADPIALAEHKAREKEYRLKNKARIAVNGAARAKLLAVEIRLQRKKLDPAIYADEVKNHHGKCDICGGNPDGRWKQLNIDHCHTTGEYRGMLCKRCNQGIGLFADDPERLRAAADYLHRNRLP